MKKFIQHIFLFFGIVAVVDFAVGKLFWYLQSSVAGGRTGSEYYACKQSDKDVIIMGSSRASHHYIPQMITDSLGLSCFNAGQDGNGIILQYGRWKMISERYAPKVIIYDVNPSFDMAENDNMTYVDHLKPFCEDEAVKGYVSDIFPMERLKLTSHLYRYNYKFIEMVSDCMRKGTDVNKGYIPLRGQIRQDMVERATSLSIAENLRLDETKLRYMERLARDCSEAGTKLIFIVSPFYAGGSFNENSFASVKRIAEKYDVPFLYYNTAEFYSRPELFKDSYHLNEKGAMELTAKLIESIEI